MCKNYMVCVKMVMNNPSDLPNGTRAADQNVAYLLVRCTPDPAMTERVCKAYAHSNIHGRSIVGVFTGLETALAALAQTAEQRGGGAGDCLAVESIEQDRLDVSCMRLVSWVWNPDELNQMEGAYSGEYLMHRAHLARSRCPKLAPRRGVAEPPNAPLYDAIVARDVRDGSSISASPRDVRESGGKLDMGCCQQCWTGFSPGSARDACSHMIRRIIGTLCDKPWRNSQAVGSPTP